MAVAAPTERMELKEGPAAALAFARGYRGESYVPKVMSCYPDAVGVPYADCENIIPMTRSLWTPEQLSEDFRQRMAGVPVAGRKKGIIVILKTERCAPKGLRACTVTTAALEKRATPLAAEFLIYGVLLKPRDHDEPAGSLKIETGPDAWKNDVAAEYQFKQGPGATLGFINAATGQKIDRTDAMELDLTERNFVKNEGRTPKLHEKLKAILARLPQS
ncbi:MAG: hypothetical protein H7343_09245 [Undibacterium sp.]|nr:hypothetical protein [Opitutaceae bacterium]